MDPYEVYGANTDEFDEFGIVGLNGMGVGEFPGMEAGKLREMEEDRKTSRIFI